MHKHRRFSAFVLLALLIGVGLAVLVTWGSEAQQSALGRLLIRARIQVGGKLPADLADTEWVLVSLNGRFLIEGTQITLKFTDGQLEGFAGCNRYGGDYAVAQDGRLRIPKTLFEITVMACAEPTGVMEQERAYVEALRAAATYRLVDDRLEIQNAAGDTVLVFQRKLEYPADPARLVGSAWRLVSLNGDELVAGSTVTLVFFNDHLAGGDAGCRGYVFAYQASGDDIRFPFQAMIGEPCLDREALMRQEDRYTTLFDWAANYRLDTDRLEILTARGEVLVFEPLPPDADAGLEGTPWRLQGFVVEKQVEGMEVPVPRVTELLEGTAITAVFGDGVVTGSAGCNRYSGRYHRNDDRLTVEELAWTEMACMTPKGVMEQEQRYLDVLGHVGSYRVVGRQLWLDADDGHVLVFAHRSEARSGVDCTLVERIAPNSPEARAIGQDLLATQPRLSQAVQQPPQPVSPVRIFLVHDPELGFLALYNRDPFRGCYVQWRLTEGLFIDPCLGSHYDRRGKHRRGPSWRGLDRFATTVKRVADETYVMVNLSYLLPGLPFAR